MIDENLDEENDISEEATAPIDLPNPEAKPVTPDQLLFTRLLDSVGLGDIEVAAFTGETKEHAEEWRTAGRKMPHYVALSLIWLAAHIIERQAANADKALIILLVKSPARELVERSQALLRLVLERVSWWPEEAFTKAKNYTAHRGGAFDLTPKSYLH